MTVTLQPTSTFNVTASLGSHFVSFLATVVYPSWLTQPAVSYFADDLSIEDNLPCYSLYHIPVGSQDIYQGRTGVASNTTRETALLDVSCWVARDDAKTWQAKLRTMADIVKAWHNRSASIVVMDYATSLSAPAATQYLVRLTGADGVETGPDPNPDIERARILVSYFWHMRA